MDLFEKINIYIGRDVDYNTEVILRADENNTPQIDTWSITEKAQPTLEQLDALISNDQSDEMAAYNAKIQLDVTNRESYSFLASTDWKVLRHIGQKAQGMPTSITEEEYLQLEIDRQAARDAIIK